MGNGMQRFRQAALTEQERERGRILQSSVFSQLSSNGLDEGKAGEAGVKHKDKKTRYEKGQFGMRWKLAMKPNKKQLPHQRQDKNRVAMNG